MENAGPNSHTSRLASRDRAFAPAFESVGRSKGTRTFLTVLIAFAVTLPLPFIAYFGFTRLMAPKITRDNAGIVLDLFQAALDKGDAIIHDPVTAATVADQAYRAKMDGPPVDGWANLMRISAVIHGDSCAMTVLSAGPDGAFGTRDDIAIQRSFDLSKPKAKSP